MTGRRSCDSRRGPRPWRRPSARIARRPHNTRELSVSATTCRTRSADLLDRRSHECFLNDQYDEAIEAQQVALEYHRKLGDRRKEGTRSALSRRPSGVQDGPPKPSARAARPWPSWRRSGPGESSRWRSTISRDARHDLGEDGGSRVGHPCARAGSKARRRRDRSLRPQDHGHCGSSMRAELGPGRSSKRPAIAPRGWDSRTRRRMRSSV